MQYYRVKDQPDVVGQIDVSKRTIRGGKVREYLRTAPNKGGYYFIDALEPYTPDTTDAFELLNDGKFGRLENLRWRLLSARLNGNLSNHIYSMEITKTDFYAYQFKPVLRLLESPSKSILIADEVGLGKTIEAGLIWTELRARYAHSRLVVLCPSFLTYKWKVELIERFGVECEVVSGYDLKEKLSSLHTLSTKRRFTLIASFEGCRSNEELIDFLEQESVKSPLIDFLVVDEAHAARNPTSATNRVTRSLREVADYVAFLSATPIMLKSRDMFQMLNILDSFTYRHEEVFEYIVKANQPLIRLRSQVLEHKPPSANEVISTLTDLQPGSGLQPALFQRESIAELVQFVSDNVEDQDAPLSDSMRADICERLDYSNMNSLIVNRTRRREAMLNQSERVPTDLMFEMSERESELYKTVSHIVREYALDKKLPAGFLQNTPQRKLSSSIPATLMGWANLNYENAKISNESDFSNGELDSEIADREKELAERQIGVIETQLKRNVIVSNCINDVGKFIANDSKYDSLVTHLQRYLRENPSDQIVLFSYFIGTLDYLEARLKDDGITSIKLHGKVELSKGDEPSTGGRNRRKKDSILKEFRNNPAIRILLTSEMGSEGIDLEFCNVIINYDLPWNPMRIEQRVGRLDRVNRTHPKIIICNLVAKSTIDEVIYERLLKRLEIFKEALGGLEEFIGKTMGALSEELLLKDLTEEQERNLTTKAALAIETKKRHDEKLENEARNLIFAGDYLEQRIKEAKSLNRRVTREDLYHFVVTMLAKRYPGSKCELIGTDPLEARVKLDSRAGAEYDIYWRKHQPDAESLFNQNSVSGVTCRFDSRLTITRPKDIEHISHTHLFVRFLSEEREGEVPHPLVLAALDAEYIESPNRFEPGLYCVVLQEMVIETKFKSRTLLYKGMRIDNNMVIEDNDAELLINAVVHHGVDAELTTMSYGVNLDYISECAFEMKDQLENRARTETNLNRARYMDKLKAQAMGLSQRMERMKQAFTERLEAYQRGNERNREANISKLVKNIKKAHETYEKEMANIDIETEKWNAYSEECAITVIEVQ